MDIRGQIFSRSSANEIVRVIFVCGGALIKYRGRELMKFDRGYGALWFDLLSLKVSSTIKHLA
jgi:hypothetical protein